MISKIDAILEINPNAKITINADDYDQIIWGDTPVISLADIEAKQAEINTRDAHIEPRRNSYPSLQEQLDMQYHDQVNGTTIWKDTIAKIKADHPKSGG